LQFEEEFLPLVPGGLLLGAGAFSFLRQCSRGVVFPMQWGSCPSCRGGQYLFDVEKVPKDAMGLRPLVPPQDKDNVHGSPAPCGKALCQPHEAESSAASSLLGFAVRFRFCAIFAAATPSETGGGTWGNIVPPRDAP